LPWDYGFSAEKHHFIGERVRIEATEYRGEGKLIIGRRVFMGWLHPRIAQRAAELMKAFRSRPVLESLPMTRAAIFIADSLLLLKDVSTITSLHRPEQSCLPSGVTVGVERCWEPGPSTKDFWGRRKPCWEFPPATVKQQATEVARP